jgi:hypothetical protein
MLFQRTPPVRNQPFRNNIYSNNDSKVNRGTEVPRNEVPISGLPPGVNFTNVLWTAFTCTDPKSAKRHSSHNCLFTLLGLACVKAVHKMLVKLTPRANFIELIAQSFYMFKCPGAQLLFY